VKSYVLQFQKNDLLIMQFSYLLFKQRTNKKIFQ